VRFASENAPLIIKLIHAFALKTETERVMPSLLDRVFRGVKASARIVAASVYADQDLLAESVVVFYAMDPGNWGCDLRSAGEWLFMIPENDGVLRVAPLESYRALLREAEALSNRPADYRNRVSELKPLTESQALRILRLSAAFSVQDLAALNKWSVLAAWPEENVENVLAVLVTLAKNWSESARPVYARLFTKEDVIQTLCIDLEAVQKKGEMPYRSVEWRPLARTSTGWAIHLEPGLILFPQ
jgi:hypothetical protein